MTGRAGLVPKTGSNGALDPREPQLCSGFAARLARVELANFRKHLQKGKIHMISSTYGHLQAMYPLLIQQFVDDYGLEDGIAVDIGTGPGHLGLELAKITSMEIRFVDASQEALETARQAFEKNGCDNAAQFIHADVHQLPFPDDSVDFVMSRGSIWFWEKPEQGLREIERILKPGAVGIIGGGLGRYIPPSMRKRLLDVIRKGLAERNEKRPAPAEFSGMVTRAGLKNSRIVDDGVPQSGKWVEIRKEALNP